MRRSASIESSRCLRWSGIRNSGTRRRIRGPTECGQPQGRDNVRCCARPGTPAQRRTVRPVRAVLYPDKSQATQKGQKSLAIRDGPGLYSSSPAAITTPA